MNYQTIFEIDARHFFTQGKQSKKRIKNPGNIGYFGKTPIVCAYRGKNNTKCAVGIFIDDDKYDPKMEGKTVGSLLYFGKVGPAITSRNIQFLLCMQQLHDKNNSWRSTESMQTALKTVAIAFKLKTKFLDELKFADR